MKKVFSLFFQLIYQLSKCKLYLLKKFEFRLKSIFDQIIIIINNINLSIYMHVYFIKFSFKISIIFRSKK